VNTGRSDEIKAYTSQEAIDIFVAKHGIQTGTPGVTVSAQIRPRVKSFRYSRRA
jgi:hypothetical protein